MNDRVVLRPYLEINQEPPSLVRFINPCQSLDDSLKSFSLINLECKLKNIDFNLLPNLRFYVTVSLVHDIDPYVNHAFTLKCCDQKTRLKSEMLRQLNPNLVNCYFFELDNTNICCKINDLYIESVSKEKIKEYYEKEKIKSIMSKSALVRQLSGGGSDSMMNNPITVFPNWEQINEQINNETTTTQSDFLNKNFNYARLKLQVIIHDGIKFDNYLTEPTFTNIIENSINKKMISSSIDYLNLSNGLKILRSSRLNGSLNGNDELFLFCSSFDPNDIEVEFFQLKNDTEISWRVFAQIDRTEIHYNCALVFRTPKYNGNLLNNIVDSAKSTEISMFNNTELKTKSINNETTNKSTATTTTTSTTTTKSKSQARIKVYFRLFKPSTKEYSDKWTFYYCPDTNNEFKSLFEEYFSYESFYKRYSDKISAPKLQMKKKVIKRKKPSTNQTTKEFSMNKILINDSVTSMETNDETSNLDNEQNLIDAIDAGLVEESPNLQNDEIYELDDDDYDSDNDLLTNTASTSTTTTTSTTAIDKVKKIKLNPGLDKSNFNSNSNDSDNFNSVSPIAMLTDKTKSLKIDSASQTEKLNTDLLLLPKNSTLESKYEIKPTDPAKPFDQQLKTNLDSCIAKMNALADRTGKSLIKFAKTRSLHELIKTQRFLLNAQDEDGNTPMHLCIIHGNFDLLEIIVDVSLTIPYQNLINFKNHKLLTPLLIAAHLNELEVCEFLLESNADLTQTDMYGCNCVHIACKNKNVKLLKIFLKYVEKGCHYSILNSINHDGFSPIHLAVMSGLTDLVRELLYMKNLKVDIQDKRAGFSALHHAVGIRNLLPITNLLVNYNSIKIDIQAFNGCTPLHLAIANKNYLITSLLINRGANINQQTEMHVHSDIELFQMSAKRNNLLRRCIETIINKYKETNNNAMRSTLLMNSVESKTTSGSSNDLGSKVDDTAAAATASTSANSQNSTDNLNHVKLSEEVKQLFESELEKEKNEELNDSNKTRAILFQHNYDALHFAQNDQWVFKFLFLNHFLILIEFEQSLLGFWLNKL